MKTKRQHAYGSNLPQIQSALFLDGMNSFPGRIALIPHRIMFLPYGIIDIPKGITLLP